MTIFKKRLFCIVAACFMLILPFISWGSGTTNEAKADSVDVQYYFNGSNIWLECQEVIPQNLVPDTDNNSAFSFRWSFSSLQDNEHLRFAISAAYSVYSSQMLSLVDATSFTWYNPGENGLFPDEVLVTIPNSAGLSTQKSFYLLPKTTADLNRMATYCNIIVLNTASNRMNVQIVKIEFGNAPMYPGFYNGHSYSNILANYNFVRYSDKNGCYIELQFPVVCSAAYSDSFLLKPRTYYLSEVDDLYLAGKQAGIVEGEKNKVAAVEGAIRETNEKWNAVLDERVAAELELAKDVVYNEGFQAGANKTFGWGMFMSSTLEVLNIPIFGEFGLGDMFMVVFGVGIVIIVLRIFAGG